MIERGGEKGLRISVPMAQQDDEMMMDFCVVSLLM